MIASLGFFVGQVVIVSLSGVMAPGPLTAATLGHGLKDRWAGVWITLGHALVELPLMFLLLIGLNHYLQTSLIRAIGFLGGSLLILMGIDLARSSLDTKAGHTTLSPLTSGVILSAGNPYFILWWATIGAGLIGRSLKFGLLGFALMVIFHLLCDLIWLTGLSRVAHKGQRLLSPKLSRLMGGALGLALMAIGLSFLKDALI